MATVTKCDVCGYVPNEAEVTREMYVLSPVPGLGGVPWGYTHMDICSLCLGKRILAAEKRVKQAAPIPIPGVAGGLSCRPFP